MTYLFCTGIVFTGAEPCSPVMNGTVIDVQILFLWFRFSVSHSENSVKNFIFTHFLANIVSILHRIYPFSNDYMSICMRKLLSFRDKSLDGWVTLSVAN